MREIKADGKSLTPTLPLKGEGVKSNLFRHSGEGRNPPLVPRRRLPWTPAFAGVTVLFYCRAREVGEGEGHGVAILEQLLFR